MPLVGTRCCRTGEPSDFDTCLQCAKYGFPESCKYPFPLIKAMRDNSLGRPKHGVSTTDLLGCTRFFVLSKDHDYVESPGDYEARFKGTVIHSGFEELAKGEPDVEAEIRYEREFIYDGHTYTITGKPDCRLVKWKGIGRLIDQKSAGRRKLHPDMQASEDHQRQLNMYRWILQGNDIEVGSLVIWYVGDTDMVQVEVPIWDDHLVEEMIRSLIMQIHYNDLPPILPSTFTRSRRTGEVTERRHWKCDSCPLREVCDSYPREGIPHDGDAEGDDGGEADWD